jgi:hypothetical protein
MSRPSILHKAEAAFVTALRSRQAIGPLAACHLYEGQSVDITSTVQLPAVTVTASAPVELVFEGGIFDLKLEIRIETQIDAEPTTPADDIHHLRVEALRDFLEDFDALTAALGLAPPRLSLSSLKLESPGEQQSQEDRTLVSVIPYAIEAS